MTTFRHDIHNDKMSLLSHTAQQLLFSSKRKKDHARQNQNDFSRIITSKCIGDVQEAANLIADLNRRVVQGVRLQISDRSCGGFRTEHDRFPFTLHISLLHRLQHFAYVAVVALLIQEMQGVSYLSRSLESELRLIGVTHFLIFIGFIVPISYLR